MSHQKTKRIENPLKGMVHSMLIQNRQLTMFSSRITQKRKPIFEDIVRRNSASRSNSMRKKIFSRTEKSLEKEDIIRFQKLFQTQQLEKREGEQIKEKEIEQPEINDSIQSSSIESDAGLVEIKRQLFPQTPIKTMAREKEELESGREWLTNSNKSWNKQLFNSKNSPPKSSLSVSTNNIEKTALKFSFQTPQKKKQSPIEQKSYYKRTHINSESKPYSFIRNLDSELSAKHDPEETKPEKDIAKQIRDLHSKLLQKTKVCSNVDDMNYSLKEENQQLREQNRKLKAQQLKLSIRPEELAKPEMPRKNEDMVKIANESIFMKVKVEKARSMLKNLIEISEAESMPANSIINLEQTLKQVLKELQF